MMYDSAVVRYNEIFLKSEYVRRKFTDRLVENIRRILNKNSLNADVIRKRHRIILKTGEPEKVSHIAAKVFGVASTSQATQLSSDLDELTEAGTQLAKKNIKKEDSFAVRAKRTGKHSYSSKDIEERIGAAIIEETNARVNLDNPDKTIYVDVADDTAYVFTEKIPGIGGLPYGTQGKVLCLLSDKKSALACFLVMRRGATAEALHYGRKEDVEPLLERLGEYVGGSIKLHVMEGGFDLNHAFDYAASTSSYGLVLGGGCRDMVSGIIPVFLPLCGMSEKEMDNRLHLLNI